MAHHSPHFDLFNGVADGICALIQLRLHQPKASTLLTGVKRDIKLLEHIDPQAGDIITVLDVSMDKNKKAVLKALENDCDVLYVDHHFAGEIPKSPKLNAIINETPDVCTAILVNNHLNGAYLPWAVVGAFGDNLKRSAATIAKPLGLSDDELKKLENLGIYINYNGYGSALEELHFHPEELYQILVKYENPMDFITDGNPYFQQLETGYIEDMAKSEASTPVAETKSTAIFILPNEAWARRVSGVFSNDLTNLFPNRAHAVLTEKANGNYLVSVRAPLSNKKGAVALCSQFETGGGREAAAGINDLPLADFESFSAAFEAAYG
jgi:single-stranded DNA-specific DHH superfamily exonuclease